MKEIKKHGLSFVEMESNTEENESFNIAKELIENLFFDMAKLSTKYCNDFVHLKSILQSQIFC